MRLRIDLAYDGSRFHGWAKQDGLRTVQGELEQWIATILRLPNRQSQRLPYKQEVESTPDEIIMGSAVELTVAGRTDAGVHARGQVAHVDLPDELAANSKQPFVAYLTTKLRRALPSDITIWSITEVSKDFDARFSATWRRYVYRVSDGVIDPLLVNQVAQIHEAIDVELLNQAATELIGLHDFVAFCKKREGATTIRELKELHAVRRPDGVVETTVRADAFCHSQVRSLMGALIRVATGQRDLAWLRGLLTATERCGEIPVMAAHGLCLEEVGYPPAEQWLVRQHQARRTRDVNELRDESVLDTGENHGTDEVQHG